MKIYQKYFSGYLITAAIMIITGIIAAISFNNINHKIENIKMEGLAETRAISESAYYIQRIKSDIRAILLENKTLNRTDEIKYLKNEVKKNTLGLKAKIIGLENKLRRQVKKTRSIIEMNYEEEELNSFLKYKTEVDIFIDLSNKTFTLLEANKYKEALRFLDKEIKPVSRKLHRITETLELEIFHHAGKHIDEIRIVIIRAINYSLLIGISTIIFLFYFGYYVSKKIANRIIEVKDSAIEVGNGNLNVRMNIKVDDEVGGLGEAFNKMIEALQEKTDSLKTSQSALRHSDKFSKNILHSMSDSICIIDVPDFRISRYNNCFKKNHGLEDGSILGKTCYEITHHRSEPCDSPDNICPLMETVKNGNDAKAEHIHFVNNKKIYVEVITSPIKDEIGRVVKVIHVSRDITDRKKSEEALKNAKEAAEAANHAKSSFLANMSHELRTPLNAIIGFSEVLNEGNFGPLNEKQKEYLEDISDSGKHLLSLINDVLDLSKVEAGKMNLDVNEFNLKDLLEGSLSLIKGKALKHNFELSVNVGDDIGFITADERKIKQVIYNFLSNAAKFTPDGGRIGIEAKRSGTNDVMVSVVDTGIGIEEKDNYKMFGKFEQIDSSATRKYGGTGLGLALCKKIIEIHGGKIWFESAGKNQGTRFSFELPEFLPRQILLTNINNKIREAQHNEKEFSLFGIYLNNYEEMMEKLGKEKTEDTIFNITQYCKGVLRADDRVMRAEKDEIIVIIAEVSKLNAMQVSNKLADSIGKYLENNDIGIDMKYVCDFATYPIDAKTSKELVEKLEQNIRC